MTLSSSSRLFKSMVPDYLSNYTFWVKCKWLPNGWVITIPQTSPSLAILATFYEADWYREQRRHDPCEDSLCSNWPWIWPTKHNQHVGFIWCCWVDVARVRPKNHSRSSMTVPSLIKWLPLHTEATTFAADRAHCYDAPVFSQVSLFFTHRLDNSVGQSCLEITIPRKCFQHSL
jgi:hypothetical protein